MRLLSSIFLLFFINPLIASNIFNMFDWTLSGYIKGETYTDSRQTTANEEDEIAFFPTPQLDDPAGHDINARGSTRMDAFETRINASLAGLTMGHAKISGTVEVDFELFEDNIIVNIPHMRHAYGKLDWKDVSFLFGYTWHPIVFLETKTVNYDGSTPFDYYARSPQLSCTYHTSKNCDLITTVTSQVDFLSTGPHGYDSNYIRWAMVPNVNFKCKFLLKNHGAGFCFDYKRLAPRLESDTGFKVREFLSSVAAMFYLELNWPVIEVCAKVNCGQNVTDYSAMGGYAVRAHSTNPITQERKYTNLNNIACWLDIDVVKNKKLQPGLFIAFSQNLGAGKLIDTENVYAFVPDVNNVFRISSRIRSQIGNITFEGEVEYTTAAYGTLQNTGKVTHTRPAELIRCTFGAYYYF